MRLVDVEWLQSACPATLALSMAEEATMLDLDFDPGLPVLDVIESLVHKVLAFRIALGAAVSFVLDNVAVGTGVGAACGICSDTPARNE